MKRCVIISAFNQYGIRDTIKLQSNDFIICADGGYAIAKAEGVCPNVVIGDFDSYARSNVKCPVTICVPAEKDDTDTLLCLKYGIEKGYNEFVIIGGIGGRLDHTIANLQTIAYALEHSKKICMMDKKNKVWMIEGTQMKLYKEAGFKFSLFSFSEKCKGVTVTGAKYKLDDATLKNDFPLGISNEFKEDVVTVQNSLGKLLIMLCKD